MKVKIDYEKCYKSGECYYNHPELFRMGDEGYPVVLVDEISDDDMRKHAEEAIEVCPAVAISLED
ncbi:MAG: ferredoxin [Pseudomonadales bacterium]|nr:ferredoxin [Pseudomonadales bacterium]NIX07926.1 ferredoxin [Pseudomonadales bacterium]